MLAPTPMPALAPTDKSEGVWPGLGSFGSGDTSETLFGSFFECGGASPFATRSLVEDGDTEPSPVEAFVGWTGVVDGVFLRLPDAVLVAEGSSDMNVFETKKSDDEDDSIDFGFVLVVAPSTLSSAPFTVKNGEAIADLDVSPWFDLSP